MNLKQYNALIEQHKTLVGFLLILILSCALFAPHAFRDDNFTKMETAHYSVMSQNMLYNNSWYPLREYSGSVIKGDHPPFHFWMNTFLMKQFGETAFATRLYCLLLTIGTILCAYLIGALWINPAVGISSAAFLMICRYIPRLALQNTLDIPFMFYGALGLLGLFLAISKHRAFFILFGVATGCAVMTKSVFGFYPFVVFGLYCLITRSFSLLYNPYFLISSLIAFSLPLSMVYYESIQLKQSFLKTLTVYVSFTTDVFAGSGRPLSPDSLFKFTYKFLQRSWVFLPTTIIGIEHLIRKKKYSDGLPLFLLLTLATVFGVVASCSWKKGVFLLPLYPSLAILAGYGLMCWASEEKQKIIARCLTFFILGMAFSSAFVTIKEPKSAKDFFLRNTEQFTAQKVIQQYQGAKKNKLIAYGSYSRRHQILYFFRSVTHVTFANTKEALAKHLGDKAALFCMGKDEFHSLSDHYKKQLNIIHAFHEYLLLDND